LARRKQCADRATDGVAIDRLLDQRPAAEGGGQFDVGISAQEHERSGALRQPLSDGEAALAVDVDVEDGGVKRLSPHQIQRLGDPADRTDDLEAPIGQRGLDLVGDDPLIFKDEDAQTRDVGH
jgi:hypothetical protein